MSSFLSPAEKLIADKQSTLDAASKRLGILSAYIVQREEVIDEFDSLLDLEQENRDINDRIEEIEDDLESIDEDEDEELYDGQEGDLESEKDDKWAELSDSVKEMDAQVLVITRAANKLDALKAKLGRLTAFDKRVIRKAQKEDTAVVRGSSQNKKRLKWMTGVRYI